MRDQLLSVKNEALAQILETESLDELEELRIDYLGRKGKISKFIEKLKKLEPAEKRAIGLTINDTKKTIQSALSEKKSELSSKLVYESEWFDLTIPGKTPNIGYFHPQTKVLGEIIDIFAYLGYQITDGPEIETDYYNFTALNFPKHHPARDSQQTIYIDTSKDKKLGFGDVILRTHTSSMQGRVMEKTKPPLRILVPGRCYRYEQLDASHGFEFWQVEGFVVDKNIKLTDLFGTIEYILKKIFGEKTKIKFACTYFPFVEPGLDAYIQCTVCAGKGCSFCKKTGWSEIMPAGMIHPNVLKQAKIDPKKWGGFAFAIGLSRVVTLRYKIKDLRILTTPDMRILKQFK